MIGEKQGNPQLQRLKNKIKITTDVIFRKSLKFFVCTVFVCERKTAHDAESWHEYSLTYITW